MNRDEAKKIVMIIASTYPNFKPNNMSMIVDSWHFFLTDYDYNDIAIALKTYVNTSGSGFAPSVDQLIAMTKKPKELTELTEAEAWDLVSKAIRNSAYHAEEEYDKLPSSVQRAIGSASQLRSWAIGDESSLETVVASNFQRSYRSMVSRQRDLESLPAEARARLESFQLKALGIKET